MIKSVPFIEQLKLLRCLVCQLAALYPFVAFGFHKMLCFISSFEQKFKVKQHTLSGDSLCLLNH